MLDISFVVCGRNDNYGGDFLSRINNFISSIIILSRKYEINSEIIIVEWNPVLNTKYLWEEIISSNILLKMYKHKIKIIIVPCSIHETFKNRVQKKLPLYDYIGKNVGIRRSNGKFIVVCSPDLIFKDDLFLKLKNNFFTDKYIYRVCRQDYKNFNLILSENKPYKEYIDEINNNVYITHLQDNIEINNLKDRMDDYPLFTNGCGDFLLMERSNWFKIKGCPEISDIFLHLDSATLKKASTIVEQWVLNLNCSVLHQDHERPHILIEDLLSNYDNDEKWGLNNVDLETINFNY